MQTFKDECAFACPFGKVSSRVWRIFSLHVSSTSGSAFVNFTLLYGVHSTVFYLKSMSERKYKGRGDVAGIDKKYQLLSCTTVPFKVLYSKMKKYFYFCICLCIICVESIKNLLQYRTI